MPMIINNLPKSGVYVYLISGMGRDMEPLGPVKIGITANVPARLASVQTGSPRRLTALCAINAPTRDIARSYEAKFHEYFGEHRLEGEWFDLDPIVALEHMCQIIRNTLERMVQKFGSPEAGTADDFAEIAGLPYFERDIRCMKAWRDHYARTSNVRSIA